MFRNYLTIALRILRRQKIYTGINIIGLALGIACFILIFLFVRHEWTYDTFHTKADRIYRVNTVATQPSGALEVSAGTPAPLASVLVETFPEVVRAVRMSVATLSMRHDDGLPVEEQVLFGDPNVFEMMTFPLISGNPLTVLRNLEGVVLTASTAQRLFGKEDPVGRRLSVTFSDAVRDFVVQGVMEDPPTNSSIQFSLVMSFENTVYTSSPFLRYMILTGWGFTAYGTFVELAKTADAAALESRIVDIPKTQGDAASQTYRLTLQPLTAVHHDPNVTRGFTSGTNPAYAYLLIGIAGVVLLIACINFMTLAVGRSAARAKEVGVRKVFGALRGQLKRQFLGEALITACIAFIMGAVLAELFLPTFNSLAQTQLTLKDADMEVVFALMGVVILVGIVAGGYPAMILSRFSPVTVFKGH